MKKLLTLIVIFFIFYTTTYSADRSEIEQRLGIFLEDLNQIGNFKKINYSPEGMFPETAKTFHNKQLRSTQKFISIFVNQKGLMEKYTDKVILGMAYFEYFYMQQLKKSKKSIERFEKNYPNVGSSAKKDLKKLYGLSKAKKSMRESLGLSLDDSPETAIKRYYVLYKLLNQAEITTNKLSKDQKFLRKRHAKISKYISNLKSITKDKAEIRLTDKNYKKDYNKNFKRLSKELKKLSHIKDYELLSSFIIEIDRYKDIDLSAVLSGYKISEFILQNLKKEKIAKKYEQDLSNSKFDKFNQSELEILGNVTNAMKINKNVKSNEIQLQILNLENAGIPVNRFLDVYRDELNLKIQTINLQVASASVMKNWELNDWANAWKNPIPKTIVNDAGIEVSLSVEELESIKAQLAMQNFKEILDLDDFKDLIQNNSENFEQIGKDLNINSQTFNFSFTLDDFARSFSNSYGLNLNNYSDLTDLANAQHGANWSVEEYASAYQANVDIINALQSGELSSFDAGQIAEAASSSLQEVADTIIAASSAGVSVDLDSTFQGMGYNSFADAVAAYNAEHGTNYTEESAREALGQ